MVTTDKFNDVPVEKLQSMIERYKQSRKKYEDKWDENRSFYNGDQWQGDTKIAPFQSDPVYNKVFEFVETMRGYESDNKWGVDAIPASTPFEAEEDTEEITPDPENGIEPPPSQQVDMEQSVYEMTDKMNKLLDFLWMDNRMQNKLAQVLQYVFLYGTGIIKCTFDPENVGDGGIGQIECRVLSPRYIFPDPDASDIHDANAVLEYHPASYGWVANHYPDRYEELLMSQEMSTSQYGEGRGNEESGAWSSSEAKRVDVWECWYNDTELLDELDESGNPIPKYPTGRYTVMTEGGIVLADGECLYSMWPYIRFIEIPRPAEFFGDCTISRAIPIQKNINTILRSLIDNGLWLVHGIWVADTTSGVTPEGLAGYSPRDVVLKHPGTDVHRDGGAVLPPHLFQLLDQQVQAFDRVVGLPDVLRGIVPSRQPVQTTMMQQESGEVRTRERQRRLEESLADLGRLWVDIVSNHWVDKRTIRTKTALGSLDMFQLSKADLDQWKWDIAVVPGSTGPLDKISTLQMLKEMRVEIGIPIPDSAFVRLASIPGLESAMTEQMAEMGQQVEDEAALDAAAESENTAPPDAPPPMDEGLPSDVLPPEMGGVPDFTNGGQIPPEVLLQMAGGGMPPV